MEATFAPLPRVSRRHEISEVSVAFDPKTQSPVEFCDRMLGAAKEAMNEPRNHTSAGIILAAASRVAKSPDVSERTRGEIANLRAALILRVLVAGVQTTDNILR